MNNIPQEELQKISDETDCLIDVTNKSVDWINDFIPEEHQRDDLNKDIKKYRRVLKRIRDGVLEKNTIGIFGASQVGKSYLVRNILRDDNNALMIQDCRDANKDVNFIEKMNPEGGGDESTSIVTRFTYEEVSDSTELPVSIKILSPKDLIIVLCDSYFKDFKKRVNYRKDDREALDNLIKLLPDLCTNESQSYLTEDDVYDIQQYLSYYLIDTHEKKVDLFNSAKYWDKVARCIHLIHPENWAKVFSILWNQHERFSEIFEDLINELQLIGFSSLVFTDFNAVLREQGTILDVKRLFDLFSEKGGSVEIVNKKGIKYKIRRNWLCALAAEVILRISEESANKHNYIKETDILDLPGAKPRLEEDENDYLNDRKLLEMLLRGKVSYLFNSYSFNFKLNNLFVCANNLEARVEALPQLIKSWIDYNIGVNPTKRSEILTESSIPPLFLIFTWWNTQLKYDQDIDSGKNDFHYKWKQRFETRFAKDILGKYNWNSEWTSSSRFKNYYLLRDFKYSDDTFDGFEGNGIEDTIRDLRTDYYQNLETSFKNSELVNSFFEEPQSVWTQTSTPNNDGSKLIISRISKIANNKTKTTRFVSLLKETKRKITDLLNNHFVSGDIGTELIKAEEDALDISVELSRVFGKNLLLFGSFIEHLSISEKEILDKYNEEFDNNTIREKGKEGPYILFLSRNPQLRPENTEEENLNILAQKYKLTHLKSNEIKETFLKKYKIDIKELFSEWNNQKNPSVAFAEIARDLWYDKLNSENFDLFIQADLNETVLSQIFNNLKRTFGNISLTNEIAGKISRYVDNYKMIEEAKELIADVTAAKINNFINTSGWDYYNDNQRTELEEVCKANKLLVEVPSSQEAEFEPLEREAIGKLFDFMENMNENMSNNSIDSTIKTNIPIIKNFNIWIDLMQVSFIANCNKVDVNIDGNNKLGAILESIEKN